MTRRVSLGGIDHTRRLAACTERPFADVAKQVGSTIAATSPR